MEWNLFHEASAKPLLSGSALRTAQVGCAVFAQGAARIGLEGRHFAAQGRPSRAKRGAAHCRVGENAYICT